MSALPGVADSLVAGLTSARAACTVPLVPAWVALTVGTGDRALPAVAGYFAAVAAHLVVLGVGSNGLYHALHRPQGLPGLFGALLVAAAALVLWRGAGHPVARRSAVGVGVGLVTGAAFGAAWSPCIGRTLGRLLQPGAGAGSRGLLLVVYAAGLALPFLLVALALVAVGPAAAWLRRHRAGLARLGGGLLGVLAVTLATGWFRTVAGHLARFVVAGT
ncbi:MAG: hypothetical protein ACYDAD_15175 [Acidimicrobiales bacterium]